MLVVGTTTIGDDVSIMRDGEAVLDCHRQAGPAKFIHEEPHVDVYRTSRARTVGEGIRGLGRNSYHLVAGHSIITLRSALREAVINAGVSSSAPPSTSVRSSAPPREALC
jgi:hypothetical protein